MNAVSPRERVQQGTKNKEGDAAEEEFGRLFGDSAEEAVERKRRGDVGEKTAPARARKTKAAPSKKEVEVRNLDRAAIRSWYSRWMKGPADSRGHVEKAQDEGEAPTAGVDCMHTRSEQDAEAKGVPIVVAKDKMTKMITARVGPSDEVGG
jgi:hypothetical protein